MVASWLASGQYGTEVSPRNDLTAGAWEWTGEELALCNVRG